MSTAKIEQPREPRIPDMSAAIFSRQWYARGGWKRDEPSLTIKVDTTRKKIEKLINKVEELGVEEIIPVWLYSSLDERLRFLHSSIGVHTVSTKWDDILLDDKRMYDPRGVHCAVMPSMQTVKWLNEVNKYCNDMEEWTTGTYIRG